MTPTVEQVKTKVLMLLGDTGSERVDSTKLQDPFELAYMRVMAEFAQDEVPANMQVAYYVLPANTTSLTPTTAGLSDFGTPSMVRERIFGSGQYFTMMTPTDVLSQRPSSAQLMEYEWRGGAFRFVGSPVSVELELRYESSGSAAPTTGSVGVDGSLLPLSLLTAAYAGPPYGYDLAVCDRWEKKGEMALMQMMVPLVRERPPMQIQPYEMISGNVWFGSTAVVDPGTTTFRRLPLSGTQNGSNLVFTIVSGSIPPDVMVYLNGQLLSPGGVGYTRAGLTITFATAPTSVDVLSVFSITASGARSSFVRLSISGTQNSSNLTFTVDGGAPPDMMLYLNGQLLAPGGVSYTLGGSTITFVTAPTASDVISAFSINA